MDDSEHGIASDEMLVRQALDRPESPSARRAITELFSRYQGRIYQWCFAVVRDHELALDAAQETLMRTYRSLGSFGGRARFSSWLFAITRNCCLKALSSPRYRPDGDGEAEDLIDPRPGPDQIFEEKMDEDAVLDMIHQRLDGLEQEVIWLRCFEKLPVDEITDLLGIEGSSGARGVLQRARRKLWAAMEATDRATGSGHPEKGRGQ